MRTIHNLRYVILILILSVFLTACQHDNHEDNEIISHHQESWIDDATIYEVNIRQYTEEGTFKAFSEHLPRLKELGVEILWLMPIHPISEEERKGELGSYYSVADYQAINPEFGTMDDFKELVKTCHDMEFKVILDWVANHTGWDNPWVSEHPEWYTQVNGEIIIPSGTDWTDVADLNYNNEEMRQTMKEAMLFWVKETDIDGYRCDVAGSVPLDFWEDVSVALNEVKPVWMLAEDGSNYALMKNAFDSNYNWYLLDSINKLAKGIGSMRNIRSAIKRPTISYPKGSYPLNFITNHDENSWNGTIKERLCDSKDLMNGLIFTAPGMPLIYSGQEASLDQRLLFFEKDQIDWSDLTEQDFYEKLVQLKKDNKALWNGLAGGDLSLIDTTQSSVLAYQRQKDQNQVTFIGNFSKEEKNFSLKKFNGGSYTDYFTDEKLTVDSNSRFKLEPWGFIILIQNEV